MPSKVKAKDNLEYQMEYKYSYIVDPSEYETHGLCDGIPLRCHYQPELEEIETLRCQENWREWVGPLGFYKGGLGPRWNFMAITVPECLPERLGVIGYANELAFLHDDCTDVAELEDAHNNDLREAFEQGATTGEIKKASTGKRAIQAHIAREMISIHKEQAMETMRAWAKFAELGSGREHTTRFTTEAEYIRYRMIDIGTMFWYGMVTFGMGISIPKDELDLAHELAEVAYLNLGLTNDLYSYQKEYDTAMAMGQDHVTNVIWVLMEERSISEDAAKEVCREKIKKTIVDFRQIVRETNARTDVSVDTKRYMEGLLYSLSGNLVWSIECPRYHLHLRYNERQLDYMKNGIPKDADTAQSNGTDETHKTNGVKRQKLQGKATNGSNGYKDEGSLVNVFANQKNLEKITKLYDEKLEAPTVDGGTKNGNEKISETVVKTPYEYVSSLPSKGLREKAIDALNVWYGVSTAKLDQIKKITSLLHNASLMLDDLEDGSNLRRGFPSTHTIFGVGQTINSANYAILAALEETHKLGDIQSLVVFTEELKNIYVGQSLDLYWTNNLICPSIDEYFQMIEGKTGGLFRMFGRLMQVHSTKGKDVDLSPLLGHLGRYFQTRDDYQNLVSEEYTSQKGFCEDLDEGKYSLPLIHLIASMPSNYLLRNILTQRRVNEQQRVEHKLTILNMMKESGSLDFTKEVIKSLRDIVQAEIQELEEKTGTKNFELKMIMEKLKV
ncbi:MAG: hypothetical protein GOMPHAMPRED_000894 [Gomphillus americanus]|uniref:Geranylgeranyl diphosphate synthase n=1 Tax=Gomphillus americanus TaxID=1940652 RepID=A0A8H3F1N5_9LECA|nr:MAG: hypothetical protein GOMPHAMPRED_000894 [Gomphillus americanus]